MAVSVSVGLLILRVVVGLTIAAHGAQKLFGWFDGSGIAKLTQGYEAQGYKPAVLWSWLVILGELGGGLSLAFGFLTPLGAAGVFGAMAMAIAKVHWKNGFWNSKRGFEFPLVNLAAATGIGVAGPGAYSLDALLRISLPDTSLFVMLAVAAVVVDVIGLAITRAPAEVPTQTTPRAQ